MARLLRRLRVLQRHLPLPRAPPAPSLSAPRSPRRAQNNNWIRKKLEDTRNKLVGVFQGPTASTEVYEVFTVRAPAPPGIAATHPAPQLALVIWRDRLFGRIKDRLIRALLALIQRDRDGEQVNHSDVRGVIESYGALMPALIYAPSDRVAPCSEARHCEQKQAARDLQGGL